MTAKIHPIDEEAVSRIREQCRSVDDEDGALLADMIEGSTNAFDIADLILERLGMLDVLIPALEARIREMKERLKRWKHEKEIRRDTLERLLRLMDVRSVERPEGTFAIQRVPPFLVEGPTESLPWHLTETTIKPKKQEIKEAIERGEQIPGWYINNGGETLVVRKK